MKVQAITVRLADDLREAVAVACAKRGMTLTGFVTAALENELARNVDTLKVIAAWRKARSR